MPIIEVKHLSYTYPGFDKPALRDVTLTIQKGEFVTLTGPSGCGKTTLCRCLNGLIPHFYGGKLEGEVVASGLSVLDHPISGLAQHVSLVFQNPENQLFALSVEKDVAFGLENMAVPREEMRRTVDWAMDMVGITNLREMAPYELSGGQQQRVAIASVLAMRPEVMVLDEPTSFLDPAAAKGLFEVVSKLNRELSVTVIMIEHRLDLLSAYADRIIIMDEGKILLDGPPREVYMSKDALLVGIGIPKVMRLYQELEENGFELGWPPVSPEELARALKGVMARR